MLKAQDYQCISYVYESGDSFKPLAQIRGRGRGGRVYYYINDQLGTPQELVAADGEIVWSGIYRTYGNLAVAAGNVEQRLRFQGQYHDEESGLHYNRYRYYDPLAGRYLSQDLIGLAGGMNGYAYVPNPLTWIDPLGLNGCPDPDSTSVTKKNSSGDDVERRFVNNQDELLAEAEKAAGGNLDNYINYKEHWYKSQDGKRRIEWNPEGHANVNEGPHVTIRDYNGQRHSVTDKIFIFGRELFDGKP